MLSGSNGIEALSNKRITQHGSVVILSFLVLYIYNSAEKNNLDATLPAAANVPTPPLVPVEIVIAKATPVSAAWFIESADTDLPTYPADVV